MLTFHPSREVVGENTTTRVPQPRPRLHIQEKQESTSGGGPGRHPVIRRGCRFATTVLPHCADGYYARTLVARRAHVVGLTALGKDRTTVKRLSDAFFSSLFPVRPEVAPLPDPPRSRVHRREPFRLARGGVRAGGTRGSGPLGRPPPGLTTPTVRARVEEGSLDRDLSPLSPGESLHSHTRPGRKRDTTQSPGRPHLPGRDGKGCV